LVLVLSGLDEEVDPEDGGGFGAMLERRDKKEQRGDMPRDMSSRATAKTQRSAQSCTRSWA
jgi:hypothetical protein